MRLKVLSMKLKVGFIRRAATFRAVSYTHLDVYKRQQGALSSSSRRASIPSTPVRTSMQPSAAVTICRRRARINGPIQW